MSSEIRIDAGRGALSWDGALGLAATLIGALAFAGWALAIARLRSVFLGITAMNPLTAVCLIAAGACLALPPSKRYWRSGLAWAVAALCALKMLDFFGLNIGVDSWMFSSSLRTYYPPNKMAPNTAICLFLSGLALAIMTQRRRWAARASQFLALAGVSIALFALLGYVYDVQAFYGFPAFIPMALNTAVALSLVNAGTLLARRDEGWMAQISAAGPGGAMARRLLPFTAAAPGLLGLLILLGLRRGWYSAEISMALAAVILMVFFSWLVWHNAVLLEAVDLKRRAYELDLKDHAQKLELANQELDAFSFSVSHDLRAPLRAIDGFSRILLESNAQRLDTEGQDALARVLNNCKRMSQLIEDLLTLSRTSRRPLQRQAFDLAALAREVAEQLQKGDPTRTNVEWVLPEGISVNADPGLMRIVLDNLLGNAWKFSGKALQARIEVGRGQIEGGLAFFVSDNGAGFDMAQAGKLFGAFQRLHSQAEFPGTGIGLTTVQRIVNRHGGRVWARSAVGQGTTFYFTLE